MLEQALREFNVDAHVVEIDTGPVITMYELSLGTGVKSVDDYVADQRYHAGTEGGERANCCAGAGEKYGWH